MSSERRSGCLDTDTLVALITGQLRLDQNPRIEEHLAECSECQQELAGAAAGLEGSQDMPPSERPALPKPGDVVAGKYRIERVLGRGGMGTVFEARHGALEQTVAIKVLHSAAPTAAARFQREAKISAQLLSEHTPRVFDLGVSEGAPFLVMEYLAGEDLSSVIARGPVEPALLVEYGQQICAALSAAHAAGIVHRDLKPSNVFVVQRPDGSPCLKILDFGISKRLLTGEGELSHELTNAHAVLGSPAYMSPEQLRESKDVDPRSDLWSLGVLLYELSTGRRPFQAWSLAGLSAAIAADAPPPPSSRRAAVPTAIDRVIMRCLKKEPKERFASAAEVADALRAALPRPKRPHARRGVVAASFVALAAAALLRSVNRPSEERKIAPVLPQPAPEPSRNRLLVHCDPPYPLGHFRFQSAAGPSVPGLERPWPIVTVCSAANTASIRAELADALVRAQPLSRAVLDPPHPCYRLELRSEASETSLDLERSPHCGVQLRLVGAGCEQVQSLEVTSDGAPKFVVTARDPSGPTRCERRVDLPFDAYGKPLHFRLSPAYFSAPDAVFSGPELELPIKRRRLRRSRSLDGPKPCVPPEYCRD